MIEMSSMDRWCVLAHSCVCLFDIGDAVPYYSNDVRWQARDLAPVRLSSKRIVTISYVEPRNTLSLNVQTIDGFVPSANRAAGSWSCVTVLCPLIPPPRRRYQDDHHGGGKLRGCAEEVREAGDAQAHAGEVQPPKDKEAEHANDR